MGNNSSRTANQDAEQDEKDLYTVLGVSEEATSDEIKKAFRKAALQFHPDKNPDRVEWAQQQFIVVQRAYEVLSDDQERAFYDRNREELARGGGAGAQAADVDLNAKRQAERAPHLSTRQLMRFFDTGAWSGFDDTDKGFFSVYGTLFELIAKDEILAQPYPGDPPFTTHAPDYPTFGTANSSYDRDTEHSPAVKHFYAIFQHNFASRKAFASADEYRTSDAPDRRYKRAMEKENKKAREEARREYNETVRSLAAFLKKRDPRFLASDAQDPMKARAKEMAQMRADLRQAAVDRALQRQREAEEWQANQQEWQKSKQQAFSEDEEGLSGEEQQEDGWYCAACDKTFLSQGGWDNHERSKKHIKTVEQLRKQMLADDAEFDFAPKQYMTEEAEAEIQPEAPVPSTSRSPSPEPPAPKMHQSVSAAANDSEDDERPRQPLGKKASKKAQKRQRELRQADALGSDLDENEDSAPSRSLAQQRQQHGESESGAEGATAKMKEVSLEKEEADEGEDKDAIAAPIEPVQLSKKDKRRAREKAKAEQQQDLLKCNVCQAAFVSRSKLFAHVKEQDHALADGVDVQPGSFGGGHNTSKSKKNKRANKQR